MTAILNAIASFFSAISNLGASVLVPIVLLIMGVCFGAGFAKSLRSALLVGVGLIGVNLVLSLLQGTVVPVAASMSNRLGVDLSIIDIGWPGAAAIAFGGKVGVFIIPFCLLINILMLVTKTTQTVNIDVWNFWQHALVGGYIAALTGSIWLAFVSAGLSMVICLVLADLTAPYFEKFMNLPGCSTAHSFSLSFGISGYVLNKLISVIPGLNKVNIKIDDLQKKLGKWGIIFEPIVLGAILGLGVGLIGGLPIIPGSGETSALAISVTMAAIMVLVPRMVSLLMEGLVPISEAAKTIIQKRGKKNAKIYIGLDSAIALGHPLSLALSVILTPVMVLLAVGLASVGLNNVMPAVDLAVLPFIFVFIAPMTDGNAFRSLIIGVIVIAGALICTTMFAPLFTKCAIAVGFIKEGAMTSSISGGCNIITFFLVKTVEYLGRGIGFVITCAVALGAAVYNGIRIRKQEAAGAVAAANEQ